MVMNHFMNTLKISMAGWQIMDEDRNPMSHINVNCFIAILAIIHKEELAKFGHRSKRKVEKFKNPAIFWWHARTCMLVISELFSLKYDKFGTSFAQQQSHNNKTIESRIQVFDLDNEIRFQARDYHIKWIKTES
jgi:hypothetical protein